MEHAELISRMTLKEKIAFLSGDTFWMTKPYDEYGIPSLFMADGPHGLRKQEGGHGDHLGLEAAISTTCFPTACASAATWDEALVYKLGRAIGEEAAAAGVNVLLGPGVNMKRNPLCGRNFEYFSEDPLLAGKLGAAWIRGAQSTGVGASLKHFACNNQENKRMNNDALVDERALREYYLPAFEIAVKESAPATVMCSYNLIDGVYASDNRALLTDILRTEWGFDGLVVSDWGAVHDRVKSLLAGCELEMPTSNGCFDKEVYAAVQSGELGEADIDRAVDRLLTLIDRTRLAAPAETLASLTEPHHRLAYDIACAAGVLLKNDGLLPLDECAPLIVGALAEQPRYQGCGSSQVTPTRLTNLVDAIRALAPDAAYYKGCTIEDAPDEALLNAAVQAARTAPCVIACMGLTPIFESEGFDRENMRIPANQTALLEALAQVNKNIVIVLVGGSPIELPWEKHARAILHMQLAGQAGAEAAAALIYGRENPSGKLAESYPYTYEDVVSAPYYGVQPKLTPYYESMFAGYRYFDSADVPVRYPFGYGLSYTSFEYSDMRAELTPSGVRVTLTVKNTGARDGAETVQLYIAPRTAGAYRPRQTLGGFTKATLAAGESRSLTVELPRRAFELYLDGAWRVEAGDYELRAAASSRDIRLTALITLPGAAPEKSDCADWYYTLGGTPSGEDFTSLHGEFRFPKEPEKGSFNMDSSLIEMKNSSLVCRVVYRVLERYMAKSTGGKVDYTNSSFKMLMDSAANNPIRSLTQFDPQSMPKPLARCIVECSNGRLFAGLKQLLAKQAD